MKRCTIVPPKVSVKAFYGVRNQGLWATLQPLTQRFQGLSLTRNWRATGLIGLILVALTAQGFAVKRTRYSHRHRRVRHLHWNPMFKGSHEMLVKQNELINTLELPRIADEEELVQTIGNEELLQLQESPSLRIASNLKASRRYCKPWTRDFVEDFSEAFYQQFKKPIQVNSAIRTVEQQRKLRRRNRNAGPIEGETASTHLTGIALDISKRGLTRVQHKWIEEYFLPLKNLGLIDPVEERRQAVFHVVVFDRYTEWRESQQLATETNGTD
jgi:uncharacterized protein YcbK (DUF882 family)